MAPITITLDEAKARFTRAHKAALRAEPLCRGLFDRWKAELLLAAHGEDDATRATMLWKLAVALEILSERPRWSESIAGG